MVDVTKLRRGAIVLVEGRFLETYLDGRVKLCIDDDKIVHVDAIDVVQVRRQPFEQGDPVRWYLPDAGGLYWTGNFEAALRDRNEALVRKPDGSLEIVSMDAVRHEDVANPSLKEDAP